jgi:hypothetical protein
MDGNVATRHEGVPPHDATPVRVLVDAGGLAELAIAGNRLALRAGLAGLHPNDPARAAQAVAEVRERIDAWPAAALQANGYELARLALADCCPHLIADRLGYCTSCLADTTLVEPAVGEWVLVVNRDGVWELYADKHLVVATDHIEPDSELEAWGWAANAIGATGTTVLTFDERPGRYSDVEYVALLAAPGQVV